MIVNSNDFQNRSAFTHLIALITFQYNISQIWYLNFRV